MLERGERRDGAELARDVIGMVERDAGRVRCRRVFHMELTPANVEFRGPNAGASPERTAEPEALRAK